MNKMSIFSGVLLASISSVCASSQQKPNIIFILCDDMGYGDLGCYGQKYISTPNIDRMAQEGMRFTQAYAGSPVSAPSRATIMTGQHSGHSHVRGNKEYWINVPLMKYGANDEYTVVGQEPYDPSHIILPEIMKKNGYTVRGNKEYWINVPLMKYGANDEYTVVGQEPYDPSHIILPEIMKKNGYTTGMFGKWAGGYEGSCSTPDKRGIDEYYGFICQFQAHLYYPNFL